MYKIFITCLTSLSNIIFFVSNIIFFVSNIYIESFAHAKPLEPPQNPSPTSHATLVSRGLESKTPTFRWFFIYLNLICTTQLLTTSLGKWNAIGQHHSLVRKLRNELRQVTCRDMKKGIKGISGNYEIAGKKRIFDSISCWVERCQTYLRLFSERFNHAAIQFACEGAWRLCTSPYICSVLYPWKRLLPEDWLREPWLPEPLPSDTRRSQLLFLAFLSAYSLQI